MLDVGKKSNIKNPFPSFNNPTYPSSKVQGRKLPTWQGGDLIDV
jgi:hypothetical protein